MDVTTRDIRDYVAHMKDKIKHNTAYVNELENKFREAKDTERRVIESESSVCTVGGNALNEKFMSMTSNNTDVEKLKNVMDKQFYNYNVMKAVGCSVYSIFYGISPENGSLSKMLHMKESVRNLHQFGDASVSGYALTGDVKDVKNMYVLKTPRTEDAEQDLRHELFIGLKLNSMRKYVPNFAFVYGGFRCSKPIIDPATKKVISWCSVNDDTMVPYVMYENITPSVSYSKYVETCTVEQFQKLFFQHILASSIANEMLGWTHYDSHGGNWLVRKVSVPGLGENFCIPYPTKSGETWYVKADSILTAIDYGQATIDYNGMDYGVDGVSMRIYGVRDGAWPLHDAYKLMMFLALSAKDKNQGVYRAIEKLFRFFNKKESFANALEQQSHLKGLYYILPPFKDSVKFTMMDLFEYALDVWDVKSTGIVTKTPCTDVLHCTSCYTFQGVLKDTDTYSDKLKARSFAEFYDVAMYLSKYAVDEYDELVKQFDYAKAKKEFVTSVSEKVNTVKRLSNIRQQSFTGSVIQSKEVLKDIMESYKNLFELVTDYEDAELLCKIGVSVAMLFQDEALIATINQYRKELSDANAKIRQKIKIVNDDYTYIFNEIQKPSWIVYERAYPWYTTSAGDIIGLKQRFERDASELFTEIRLPAALLNRTEQPVIITEDKPVKERIIKVPEVRYVDKGFGLFPSNPKVKAVRDDKGNLIKLVS